MKRKFYVMAFIAAFAVAYAASQNTGSGGTSNSSQANTQGQGSQSGAAAQTPVTSGTPKTTVGSGSQSSAGTPVNSNAGTGTGPVSPSGAVQNSQRTNAPGAATDASGGGASGSAGTGSTSQVPETPATPGVTPSASDAALTTQIQDALSKEPTLSGDSVRVNVTSQGIELSGNVATSREKQTAGRIAQSYGGNKKLINHITITGPRNSGVQLKQTPGISGNDQPVTTVNPATNPEPNKGSRPPR
jgi:osmotically-inducible protein OsmY